MVIEEQRLMDDQPCAWILFGRFLMLSVLN